MSLATTIAACALNGYRQHTGFGNIAALLDTVPGGSDNMCGYVSRMPYDPITRRFFLSSSDDPGSGRRLIAFDVATDAWLTLIPSSGGVAHGYGNQWLDIPMRRYWYGNTGTVGGGHSYRNVDTGVTTSGAQGPWSGDQDGPAGEYFPERKTSYFFFQSQVWQKREDAAWTQVSGSYPMSVHNFAHYNGYHKCLVFGGGNYTSSNLWRINQDGTIQQFSGLPTGFDSVRSRFIANDATGEFFVYQANAGVTNFRKFNPSVLTSAAWTNPGTAGIPPELFGQSPYTENRISLIAENMFTHGALVFTTGGPAATPTMWVYRYR